MKDLIANNSLPGHVLNIDVSSQNMECILKYVYTGECELQEHNVFVLTIFKDLLKFNV